MRWPFVSRRAYDLLYETYERTILERNEQQSRADRLADQLVDRFGFQPVSAPVRAEMKQAAEDFEKLMGAEQYEDAGAGMIADGFFDDATKVPS